MDDKERIKSMLIEIDSMLERQWVYKMECDNEYDIRNVEIARKHLKNCFGRVSNFEEPATEAVAQ